MAENFTTTKIIGPPSGAVRAAFAPQKVLVQIVTTKVPEGVTVPRLIVGMVLSPENARAYATALLEAADKAEQ